MNLTEMKALAERYRDLDIPAPFEPEDILSLIRLVEITMEVIEQGPTELGKLKLEKELEAWK